MKKNKAGKKEYTSPKIRSEKILEAGMGAKCNGSSCNGGRKDVGDPCGPPCNVGSYKT